MLADPAAPRYGTQLMRLTGLRSGTLYPLLRRLADEGLVTCMPEAASPRELRRPRRKYYRITPEGERHARDFLIRYRGW
jgi:DNA-binding PadR family transcriptional regulator